VPQNETGRRSHDRPAALTTDANLLLFAAIQLSLQALKVEDAQSLPLHVDEPFCLKPAEITRHKLPNCPNLRSQFLIAGRELDL
jgi:hypothetical protein